MQNITELIMTKVFAKIPLYFLLHQSVHFSGSPSVKGDLVCSEKLCATCVKITGCPKCIISTYSLCLLPQKQNLFALLGRKWGRKLVADWQALMRTETNHIWVTIYQRGVPKGAKSMTAQTLHSWSSKSLEDFFGDVGRQHFVIPRQVLGIRIWSIFLARMMMMKTASSPVRLRV